MRWSWREIAAITEGHLRLPEGCDGASSPPGVISIDTRTLLPGDIFLALVGDRHDGHAFVSEAFARGASGAIVDAGADLPASAEAGALVLTRRTVEALDALASRARSDATAGVIAVTGSNGKTTTREMIATILSGVGSVLRPAGNRNNQIGLPLTMTDLTPEHDWAVLELAMNRAGEIAALSRLARPTVAVITNVGRAHLGPLGNLDAVRAAKLEIVEGLVGQGPLFVPSDDEALAAGARATGHPVRTVGASPGADYRVTRLALDAEGRYTLALEGLPEVRPAGPGRGAALAAAIALAVCIELGVDPRQAAERLALWRPFPGRLSIRHGRDVTILDDSYNANPDSMALALDTLAAFPCGGRRIAVLGDMLELGDHSRAAHRDLGARLRGLDHVYLVGEAVRETQEAARAASADLPVDRYPSADGLIPVLQRALRAGDVVLVKASRAVALDRVVEAIVAAGEGA